MSIWTVLGIEKTKDKNEIKEAYVSKLVSVNPEDDPEGFMELRGAYEEANRLADLPDEEEEKKEFSDTPVGRWMSRVDIVYKDFTKRISSEVWDELLEDDVCFGLDARDEAEEELLSYLSEHHLLPHAIWKKIDECFEISERRDELCEKFPADFIRYIINNAKYEDSLNFYMFEQDDPALPYDEYIMTYLDMVNSLQNRDVDRVKDRMETLETMPVSHPFARIQKVHLYIYEKKYDEAYALAKDLIDAYPNVMEARIMMAELYWAMGKVDDAKTWYEKTLELAPEHAGAKCGIADCEMHDGRYVEAKAIYRELLNRNRFATYIHKCMMDCNEKLIPIYQKRLDEDPEDDEARLELSWCMYQNYRFEESLKLLEKEKRDSFYELDFSYLRGRSLLQLERLDEAEECFEEWINLFPLYKDEPGEPGKRNREREGLVYFFIAEVKIGKKDPWDALTYNDTAYERAVLDKGMILTQRGAILLELSRYDEAITSLNEALELEPVNFEAYTCIGECYEKQGRLREAIENYEASIESYPYFIKPYIQQVKILLDIELYDEAEQVLDRLDSLELDSDQSLLYRARLMWKKAETSKHMALTLKLEQRLLEEDHVSDLEDISEVYYEKARAIYFINVDDRKERIIDVLDKAIAINANKAEYYYMYGCVLWEFDDREGALKQFNKALEVGGDSARVYFQMAGIYHEMEDEREERVLLKITEISPDDPEVYGHLGQFYEDNGKIEEAIDAYTKQLEIAPSGYYYVARGILHFDTGSNDDSIADYQAALECGDNEAYANYNMGRVYMATGKLDEAKLLFEKAIETADSPTEIFYRYLAKCLCRMGQWEEAVKTLRLQIRRRIRPTLAYFYLGQIYRGQLKKKDALKAFNMGLKKEDYALRNFVGEITELYMDVPSEGQSFEDCVNDAVDFVDSTLKNHYYGDETQYALAYIYGHTGQYDKEYKIRKKLSKYDAQTWYDFALCAVHASENERITEKKRSKYLQEAANAFSQAAGYARKDCKSYESMAYGLKTLISIALDLRMNDTAKELLDEMKDTQMCDHCMKPKCYEYYYQLARYELREGNKEAARTAIEKACEIAPDDVECREFAKEIEE